MSRRAAALRAAERLASALDMWTAGQVRLNASAVLDRSDAVPLGPAGAVSPNGSCRLIEASDGWIAVNLPREDDADLVPAWTGCAFGDPVWQAIGQAATAEPAGAFVARGAALGLAVARLGEAEAVAPAGRDPGGPSRVVEADRLRVLDLSALWAGPLCAGILAQAGHEVLKVESAGRPDPLPLSAPAHDARLNGLKQRRAIAFTAEALLPLMTSADIIVTSARPRAFAGLGLMPDQLLAANPRLVWVAITGHGWHGEGSGRVGFGDDAAIAGGLADWVDGQPRFAGDALADPLTGLAAAVAALDAVERGGGALVDVPLAGTAAWAATL